MTTIALRYGLLVADSCISHEDHDGGAVTSRTIHSKLVQSWPGDSKGPRMFIASKGDADVGTDVDDLVKRQFYGSYRRCLSHGFCDTMNTRARRAARVKMIGECDYAALITWFTWDKDAEAFQHAGSYELNNSGRIAILEGDYHAIGCDKAIALGALCAGASAEDAVRAAAKHGAYTAMPMTAVRLREDGRVNYVTVER